MGNTRGKFLLVLPYCFYGVTKKQCPNYNETSVCWAKKTELSKSQSSASFSTIIPRARDAFHFNNCSLSCLAALTSVAGK